MKGSISSHRERAENTRGDECREMCLNAFWNVAALDEQSELQESEVNRALVYNDRLSPSCRRCDRR
jgi:hypothetical protein